MGGCLCGIRLGVVLLQRPFRNWKKSYCESGVFGLRECGRWEGILGMSSGMLMVVGTVVVESAEAQEQVVLVVVVRY
jgi:hypothetical protein